MPYIQEELSLQKTRLMGNKRLYCLTLLFMQDLNEYLFPQKLQEILKFYAYRMPGVIYFEQNLTS